MTELGVALGLVLAIEGILMAGWPDLVRRVAAEIQTTPQERLRLAGVVGAIVGVVMIWLLRR